MKNLINGLFGKMFATREEVDTWKQFVAVVIFLLFLATSLTFAITNLMLKLEL